MSNVPPALQACLPCSFGCEDSILVKLRSSMKELAWFPAQPTEEKYIQYQVYLARIQSPMDASQISALRDSIKVCSDRGLYVASKWASELYTSLPKPFETEDSLEPVHFSTPTHARSPRQSLSFASPPKPEQIERPDEEDLVQAARTFFECREFNRVAHVLKACTGAKARFLVGYSEFLATEKKAADDWEALTHRRFAEKFQGVQAKIERNRPQGPLNTALQSILLSLGKPTDAFLLFLKGVVLQKMHKRAEAIECLILSINQYSWNWSAWLQLGLCLHDADELEGIKVHLPEHIYKRMLGIRVISDLHAPNARELDDCDYLLQIFPKSPGVMAFKAVLHHHEGDAELSGQIFEEILRLDPYRVDDIDLFSNILYLKNDTVRMNQLAHQFITLGKNRPEVCALIGNHYSLRRQHEKSIKYFKRAVLLDRTRTGAWTVMGHEFIELKNSHAAIEAYRRAIDINPKDYRPWYGLGQAYELLSMHQYALYYYQRAMALKPDDARIWKAMGLSYKELGRYRDAMDCYKRVIIQYPTDIETHAVIAELCDMSEERATAAFYNSKIIHLSERAGKPVIDYAKSLIYVANFHLNHGGGNTQLAGDYLVKVKDSNSEAGPGAGEMLRKAQLTGKLPMTTR